MINVIKYSAIKLIKVSHKNSNIYEKDVSLTTLTTMHSSRMHTDRCRGCGQPPPLPHPKCRSPCKRRSPGCRPSPCGQND